MENHGGIILEGETPYLSTRALWESYQQSYLLTEQEKLGKGNVESGLKKYLCLCLEGIYNMP
jgi:hypothetical protein